MYYIRVSIDDECSTMMEYHTSIFREANVLIFYDNLRKSCRWIRFNILHLMHIKIMMWKHNYRFSLIVGHDKLSWWRVKTLIRLASIKSFSKFQHRDTAIMSPLWLPYAKKLLFFYILTLFFQLGIKRHSLCLTSNCQFLVCVSFVQR